MAEPDRQDVGGSLGKALLDVPIGDMIVSLGQAIASAQFALDMNSLRTAQVMTGEYEDEKGVKHASTVLFDGQRYSLMELGFTPTFYQFTETSIEIKVSMSMSTEQNNSGFSFDMDAETEASAKLGLFSAKATAKMHVSTVGASYSSKFNYSADGSSVIRTKLMPVPPPAVLEERIRKSLDAKKAGG